MSQLVQANEHESWAAMPENGAWTLTSRGDTLLNRKCARDIECLPERGSQFWVSGITESRSEFPLYRTPTISHSIDRVGRQSPTRGLLEGPQRTCSNWIMRTAKKEANIVNGFIDTLRTWIWLVEGVQMNQCKHPERTIFGQSVNCWPIEFSPDRVFSADPGLPLDLGVRKYCRRMQDDNPILAQ